LFDYSDTVRILSFLCTTNLGMVSVGRD